MPDDVIRKFYAQRCEAYAWFSGVALSVENMLNDHWIDGDRARAILAEAREKLEADLAASMPAPAPFASSFADRLYPKDDSGLRVYNPDGVREVQL